MKVCISKHEITVMLKLSSDTPVVLKQICIFKTVIIAKLTGFLYECSDEILLSKKVKR